MTTVSDFIRYVREQVLVNPDVANYELVVSYDNGEDNIHIRADEFQIDHLYKELVLVTYNGDLEEIRNDFQDDGENA